MKCDRKIYPAKNDGPEKRQRMPACFVIYVSLIIGKWDPARSTPALQSQYGSVACDFYLFLIMKKELKCSHFANRQEIINATQGYWLRC